MSKKVLALVILVIFFLGYMLLDYLINVLSVLVPGTRPSHPYRALAYQWVDSHAGKNKIITMIDNNSCFMVAGSFVGW